MKSTLIITALTAMVAAQGLTDIPTCSLTCLTTAITGLGCGLLDFACSCQKSSELTPVVTPCVQSVCSDPAHQSKTLEVLSSICAAAGFSIKAPVPPASSTTDVTSEHPAPTHSTFDVPNLPSSLSALVPLPSLVDTIIVSRPLPNPTSVRGVFPPYPMGTSAPSRPAPSDSGVPSQSLSPTPPEFTGAAAAVNVPIVAAGVLGLAAFVL